MNCSRQVYLIFRLLGGIITEKELVEFFEVLKSISFNYMLHLKRKGYKIGESDESLEDLSNYFMAKLFKRDDAGNFVVWHKYVEQQGRPNENNIESFLKRIAFKKTKQELAQYYQEKDLIGANINRMVTQYSKDHYNILDTKSGKMLVHGEDTGKPITPLEYDEANKLFDKCEHASKAKMVFEMLDRIHQNGHARSVRTSDIVSIIRNRMPGSGEKIYAKQKDGAFEVLSQDQRDEFFLRDKAFKFIDDYCQNPNNNIPWARFDYWPYASVVKDLITVFCEGTKDSTYDCFAKHFPEVRYKEYRNSHRFRVEYLFKMTTNYLKRHVKTI